MVDTEKCIKCGRTLHYDPPSGESLPEWTKDHGHMCIADKGKRCEYRNIEKDLDTLSKQREKDLIDMSIENQNTKKEDKIENKWKKYTRIGTAEMRPYIPGEELTNISVSPEDSPTTDLGMIARNPENHNDQWYVNREYFEKNFRLVEPGGNP